MGTLKWEDIKASWAKTIKEQSMPKTIRYQRAIYTDDDIARMLGVNRSDITLVRDSMPVSKRWEIIIEQITDDIVDTDDES